MRRKRLALAVLLLVLFSFSLCPAATLVVDLNGTGDYTDIQSAIDAADAGPSCQRNVTVLSPSQGGRNTAPWRL